MGKNKIKGGKDMLRKAGHRIISLRNSMGNLISLGLGLVCPSSGGRSLSVKPIIVKNIIKHGEVS